MRLPQDFIHQMQALLPDYAEFEEAFGHPAPVSLRLNPLKARSALRALAWCPQAYTLPERPSFTLDPRLHAGAYYVQDASCMLLEAVLDQLQISPLAILDACAAPGGKSTHLASIYPQALVVANEVIRSRSHILEENLTKWGSPNLASSNLDPAAFGQLPQSFDLILADVPCSGEGLFRKDPQACQEWSLEQVELCARRQKRILNELWPSLKPGGYLVYSTCTYNRQENEDQLSWLKSELGAEAVSWHLPEHWPVVQQEHQGISTLRCYPHKLAGEGFFLAVVQKPATAERTRLRSKQLKYLAAKDCQSYQSWLKGDWYFAQSGSLICAWPQAQHEILQSLNQLNSLKFGLQLAEIKGKDLRLQPALALSSALQRSAFSELKLELPAAIRYLQHEALYDLPEGKNGPLLLSFKGWPLGWIKRIQTRGNNLYPNHWRIRMQPSQAQITQAWEQLSQLLPLSTAS